MIVQPLRLTLTRMDDTPTVPIFFGIVGVAFQAFMMETAITVTSIVQPLRLTLTRVDVTMTG